MNTTRTWAIAGVSAALILGTAGASYAIPTGSDGTCPHGIEREQLLQERQNNYGGPAGGTYGAGHGDQTGNQTRDQVRDQLRDTENCDGDGPLGDGPLGDGPLGDGPLGDGSRGGGMMGGYGSGR